MVITHNISIRRLEFPQKILFRFENYDEEPLTPQGKKFLLELPNYPSEIIQPQNSLLEVLIPPYISEGKYSLTLLPIGELPQLIIQGTIFYAL